MARYVVDPATLLYLIDAELLLDASHQLVAPSSIRLETLQVLLAEVGQGSRTDKQALVIHERLTGMKIRLLGDRVSRGTAWKIARQHDWDSIRDAEYVAVTVLQADALVTVDPTLAARAKGVVTLAPVESLLHAD